MRRPGEGVIVSDGASVLSSGFSGNKIGPFSDWRGVEDSLIPKNNF